MRSPIRSLLNIAAALTILISCPALYAQTATHFTLPAQPLADALRAVGTQTNTSVVFDPSLVEGRRAPAIDAQMSLDQALSRLLAGTGLTHQFLNERTVVLATAGGKKPSADTSQLADMRLAQAEQTQAEMQKVESQNSSEKEKSSSNESASSKADESTSQGIPEILVTGKKTLNTDIKRTQDDAQPYQVFERDVIERSAARTVEDFLRQRLTASSDYAALDQSTGSSAGNASLLSLRGLSIDETLILINGRRSVATPSDGELQPNLNGIPMSAIERIEVLPSSAAGIYGGNAVGGVINVILRGDYSGVEAELNYESPFTTNAAQQRISVTAGLGLEGGRTNILATANYSSSDALIAGDYDYIQRYRNILSGIPGALYNNAASAQVPLGATTNIHASNGANLTLKAAFGGGSIGSPFTSLPVGYAGVASDNGAALIANAGRYNLDLAPTAQTAGALNLMLVAPRTKAANVTVRRAFTDSLDAFVSLLASDTESMMSMNPVGFFALVASDAGNPFNQPIRVTAPAFGSQGRLQTDLESLAISGGLVMKLAGHWSASLDYGWSQARSFSSSDFGRYQRLASNAAVKSGAIDVFRDTRSAQSDFSQVLLNQPDKRGPGKNGLTTISARVGGPLPFFSMPGGKPLLTGLIERREDRIGEYTYTLNQIPLVALTPDQSRRVNGAYAELLLPIVGEATRLRAINLLELQVAGRWDQYESNSTGVLQSIGGAPFPPLVRGFNKFESLNPSIALRYKPIADLALRASYGTAFRPPSYRNVVPSSSSASFVSGLSDPLRGGEPLGEVTFNFLGGNQELDPEKSTSLSVGLIVTPAVMPGLRLSADWSRIRKRDAFGSLDVSGSQLDLNTLIAEFPQYVVRAAPGPGETVGPIVAVDSLALNFSRADVEAIDLTGDYTLQTAAAGTFTLAVRATRLLEVSSQFSSDYPVEEQLDESGIVKWRANASVTWDYRNWTTAWAARYYDSYFVLESHTDFSLSGGVLIPGTARVPSQSFHDVFTSYRFDSEGSAPGAKSPALLSGVEIQAGIKNIFNTRPAFNGLFEPLYVNPLADMRRAVYYLSLRKAF